MSRKRNRISGRIPVIKKAGYPACRTSGATLYKRGIKNNGQSPRVRPVLWKRWNFKTLKRLMARICWILLFGVTCELMAAYSREVMEREEDNLIRSADQAAIKVQLCSTALRFRWIMELLPLQLNAISWSCSLTVYQITAIVMIFLIKHNDNDA